MPGAAAYLPFGRGPIFRREPSQHYTFPRLAIEGEHDD